MLPVTPQPHDWLGVCVSIGADATSFVSLLSTNQVVVDQSGCADRCPNRTQHDPVISRVRATSPRLPSSRAPRSRTETLLLPKQACFHLHLYPKPQSERQDLNLRSPSPRPGAITRLRYVLIVSSPDHPTGGARSRTQPARLERPMTSPEVERAVLCAYVERQVGREALESSSAAFQTAAKPSQLPAHVVVRARKNPMPCDTGLWLIPCESTKRHKRKGIAGGVFAD